MRNPRESQYSNGAIPPDPEEARQLNALHGPIPQPSRLLKGTAAVLGLGTVAFLADACTRDERPAEVRPADAVVEVNAIAGTITDFVVHKGDKLKFEASGTWCMGPGECGGPDGIRKPTLKETNVVIGGPKIGTLIGAIRRVNNKGEIDFSFDPMSIFPVGSESQVVAEADGKLVFGMNDLSGTYGDNTGSVEVKIFRETGSSPPQVKETPKPVQPTPEQRVEAGWQVYRYMNLPLEVSYPPDLFNKNLSSKEIIKRMESDIPIASASVIMSPVNPWVRLEDVVEQAKSQLGGWGTEQLQIVNQRPIRVGGQEGVRLEYTYNDVFSRVWNQEGRFWYFDQVYKIEDLAIRNNQLWKLQGAIHFYRMDRDREPSPTSVTNKDRYYPALQKMFGSVRFLQGK